MDYEDRELLTHLFAKATAMLEDATQLAADGQSSRLTPDEYRCLSRDLQRATANALELAKALGVITGSGPESSPKTPDKPG